VLDGGDNEKRLVWILLDPRTQGAGIGLKIMERVIYLGRTSDAELIRISASHKSAPFFEKFGASTVLFTKDGWGPDMHKVEMELQL
jgi:hypothetical protein